MDINDFKLVSNDGIPAGTMALLRHGEPVWFGELHDPAFHRVDTDEMHVNPRDWEALRAVIEAPRHNWFATVMRGLIRAFGLGR